MTGFDDGKTTASYAYNPNGLRMEKIVNGQRINHVWDGSQQIVADIVDNQFYEAECYIRGTSLAATYNYCNGEKSSYTYYIQNAHGDVVNLTDADGAVTKTYHYDAFGVERSISDADTNAFRYCGEYFDTETGTIYLRARYYQASIGRFTQRDTVTGKIGDPLSLNLYTYCHNNPVFYFDPSGHKAYGHSSGGHGGSGWRGYKEYDNKFEEVIDVLGDGLKLTVKDWMESSKPVIDKAKYVESQKIGVKSYGLYASAMTGIWSFDSSINIVFDHEGNIVLQRSLGTGCGTGTPSISGGISESTYWVKNYTFLEDAGISIGGSGGPLFESGGLDVNFAAEADIKRTPDGKLEKWQLTKDGNISPIGVTASYGGALNSTIVGGAEGHIQGSQTDTLFTFNYYTAYDQLYEKIMAW